MDARYELASIITHGIGTVLAVAGLVTLVLQASRYGTAADIVACSIFGATLVAVYAVSTLYHITTRPEAKRILRIIDHCAIYLVIAGTYMPFALISLGGARGWTLFGVVWALAVTGIVLKLFFTGRFSIASTLMYLGMGWLALLLFKPLQLALSPLGLFWLIAGGVAYSAGVIFYAWKSLPYHHAIWHLFVMAGSAFHYTTIALYVVPRG